MLLICKKLGIICLLIVILILTTILPGEQATLGASMVYPESQGKAAILMDFNSGRILYEKNSNEQLPPASVTKIMTALLVIENGNLDQVVQISKTAADTRECTIYLQEGEKRTRRELLYAAMLPSANDASVALAESVSSNAESFVALMNQRAHELGMHDTNFCNPHGLHSQQHYTTAYDLALLSREAMKHEIFQDLVETHNITIPGWPGGEDRHLWNQNRLLYRYDGTLGIKTGYTRQAGNCLVGAAKKGDMTLIAVSLNSPAVYDDVIQMLDYGFDNYQMVKVELEARRDPLAVNVIKGEAKTVIAKPETEMLVAATAEERSQLSCIYKPCPKVAAPVAKGDLLGVSKVYKQNEEIASFNLVAADSVNIRPGMIPFFAGWSSSLFKWFVIIALVSITFRSKKAQEILKSVLRFIVLKIINRRSSRSRSIRYYK